MNISINISSTYSAKLNTEPLSFSPDALPLISLNNAMPANYNPPVGLTAAILANWPQPFSYEDTEYVNCICVAQFIEGNLTYVPFVVNYAITGLGTGASTEINDVLELGNLATTSLNRTGASTSAIAANALRYSQQLILLNPGSEFAASIPYSTLSTGQGAGTVTPVITPSIGSNGLAPYFQTTSFQLGLLPSPTVVRFLGATARSVVNTPSSISALMPWGSIVIPIGYGAASYNISIGLDANTNPGALDDTYLIVPYFNTGAYTQDGVSGDALSDLVIPPVDQLWRTRVIPLSQLRQSVIFETSGLVQGVQSPRWYLRRFDTGSITSAQLAYNIKLEVSPGTLIPLIVNPRHDDAAQVPNFN